MSYCSKPAKLVRRAGVTKAELLADRPLLATDFPARTPHLQRDQARSSTVTTAIQERLLVRLSSVDSSFNVVLKVAFAFIALELHDVRSRLFAGESGISWSKAGCRPWDRQEWLRTGWSSG